MDKEQKRLMLEAKLAMLQKEHRELDEQIQEMILSGVCDMLRLQRRKKRKLVLKDEMESIKHYLIPDILA